MLEYGAFVALGLGGFGAGLLLSLFGNLVLNRSAGENKTGSTPQTFFIRAELPSIPIAPVQLETSRQEELVKCPCGLELPETAMAEHVTVSGHSKPASSASGGGNKVWDLNEAVVETTSPDCYKCGKPVYGLKRMGKTIYVAHLGCTDKTKPTPNGEKQPNSVQRTASKPSHRSRRCPLCRRMVAGDEKYVEMRSKTGHATHFHKSCVEQIGDHAVA